MSGSHGSGRHEFTLNNPTTHRLLNHAAGGVDALVKRDHCESPPESESPRAINMPRIGGGAGGPQFANARPLPLDDRKSVGVVGLLAWVVRFTRLWHARGLVRRSAIVRHSPIRAGDCTSRLRSSPSPTIHRDCVHRDLSRRRTSPHDTRLSIATCAQSHDAHNSSPNR